MIGTLLLALVVALGMLAALLCYAAAWILWPVEMLVLTFLGVALILAGLVWMKREREREMAR